MLSSGMATSQRVDLLTLVDNLTHTHFDLVELQHMCRYYILQDTPDCLKSKLCSSAEVHCQPVI